MDYKQIIRDMFQDIDRSNYDKWLSITKFKIEDADAVHFKNWIAGWILDYFTLEYFVKNRVATRANMIAEVTKIQEKLKETEEIIRRESVSIVLVKSFLHKEESSTKSNIAVDKIEAMLSAIKEMESLCDFAIENNFPSSVFTNENGVTLSNLTSRKIFLSRLLVDWKYLTGDFPTNSIQSPFVSFVYEIMKDLKQYQSHDENKGRNAIKSLTAKSFKMLKEDGYEEYLKEARPYPLPQFKIL